MGWFDKFLNRFRRKVVFLQKHPNIQIRVPRSSDADKPRRPEVPGVAKLPDGAMLKTRGLSYFVDPGQRDWVYPQYDHFEVEMVYDVESYAARALRAKLALFLKEGFEFIGRNEERIKYVKERFYQIWRATRIPTEILLFQTCRDLIAHSNAYWLKVRDLKASGGRERTVNGKKVLPVAGLFPLPPETMVPELDGAGNILRWKQVIGDQEKIFSVNDIVHFYTNKKSGYPLGVPSIWPAIDDIRALRSLEANVEALVHKHIFPVFLWKVGTKEVPAATYPDGTTEIDVVQQRVMEMPAEGSLVVSERFDVEAIGAENKALRVEFYLTHFLGRVFAGLDMSSIDAGSGDTSSRSTAQTLSRNLVDTVKLQQVTIEKFMELVIAELLAESTFPEGSLLSSDNAVHLRFLEIDKEAKTAVENHLADLFAKDTITHSEMRIGMGREPLTDEEREGLRWWMIGREEALIKAGDEGLVTKTLTTGAGTSRKTGPTGGNKPSGAVGNKNRPRNQHGTRPAPKLNRDSYAGGNRLDVNPILKWHMSLAEEFQTRWVNHQLYSHEIEPEVRLTYETAQREMVGIIRSIIRRRYRDGENIFGIYKMCEDHLGASMARLRNELIRELKGSTESPAVIFESLRWRTVLVFQTERAWSANIADYRWMRHMKVDMQVLSSENACDECRSKLTTIKWDDKLGEAKIPPHHPLCGCWLEPVRQEG